LLETAAKAGCLMQRKKMKKVIDRLELIGYNFAPLLKPAPLTGRREQRKKKKNND